MDKSKVVFIGCRGHWGYAMRGMDTLQENDAEIAGYSTGCEDAPDKMRTAFLERFHCEPEYFSDYRTMFDAVKPDIAVIDGPFDRHAEMCIEALKRNIHVFCEKPIALSLAELADIQAAYRAARKGTKLISMVGLRLDPAMAAAYAAVKLGAVGKVKMVSARKSYKLGSRPEFYKHRATYGGTIPWVGSHALDWMIYFGGAPFEKIFAFHNKDDNRDHDDLEMNAVCCGVLTNGVTVSCTIDYLRPAAAATHGDDRVRVAGTEGVIEVARGEVTLLDSTGERLLPPADAGGIFENFVRHIRYNTECCTDAEETFELTRACLTARDFADA